MNVNRDSDDTFPNVCLTDSSEDDLATEDLETLAFLARAGREAQQQLRQPQHNIGLRGHQYILEVLNGNPRNCRELFRLEVDAFRALCSLLRSNRFLKDTRKGLTVEEQIGMFTSVLAAGDEQRIVGQRFQHSTETVNAHVRNVMKALCRLGTHLIYPTHTSGVHPTIAANPRNYPWFEGCIGAIDGTMIDAVVPAEVREAYRNRHGKVAQNVLCVCDLDMKFTFLYTGWEGSSHDARVFIDALSQGRNAFPMPLDGHYYLVDSAYPCTRGFMPPYPRERYHRSDRQGQRGFRGYKDYFNHRHSCIRNVIERTFGVLKSRFRILRLMPGYKVGRQGDLIIACCTLHNFIRMASPNDRLFEEWRDMELSPSGHAYSDAAVSGNHPDMTVESARAMAAIRDDIAKRMWEARSGH
ncbi:putative nuclease HARBI1 [Juglans regia]|uniref:Nuclease HARBI1 n=1 Tax=Juglans regia TaxID=51240 RepID=A0A6P9E3V4_JUGRE|nr:putative nuclease HARBI1 [Juglans regia]